MKTNILTELAAEVVMDKYRALHLILVWLLAIGLIASLALTLVYLPELSALGENMAQHITTILGAQISLTTMVVMWIVGSSKGSSDKNISQPPVITDRV